MNYPFETTKKGHPILDTEEKLQWYMNRLLHREVDLYYVNAEVNDLETVWLKKKKDHNAGKHDFLRGCSNLSRARPLWPR